MALPKANNAVQIDVYPKPIKEEPVVLLIRAFSEQKRRDEEED